MGRPGTCIWGVVVGVGEGVVVVVVVVVEGWEELVCVVEGPVAPEKRANPPIMATPRRASMNISPLDVAFLLFKSFHHAQPSTV